ncbi:MAG: circadian clock KaiB family protein [Spirochaetia bacterium]
MTSFTGGEHDASEPPEVFLVLYIMGSTPNSRKAVENTKKICEEIRGCELDVVDLQEEPERAQEDQIIAIPTLVKMHPEPQMRILGALSDGAKVQDALGLGGEDGRGK